MIHKLHSSLRRGLVGGFAFSSVILLATPVYAEMALTDAARTRGFTLSTFADRFMVVNEIGPLDVAFIAPFEFPDVTRETGDVLVTEHSTGRVLRFPTDRDEQHRPRDQPDDTPGVIIGPAFGGGNAAGIARLFGAIYVTQQNDDRVIQIAPDGTFIAEIATGIDNATGIVVDPANGVLYVSQAGGSPNVVYRIDPSRAVDTTPEEFIADAADGLDIACFLAVNTTGGQLIEIDVGTAPARQRLIGNGGSRGDFIRQSPNGSFLLLTQSDRVLNLRLPNGLVGEPPLPPTTCLAAPGR